VKIPLSTTFDPSQVDRVRDLLDGRACVVVGSAPLKGPPDLSETDVVIAVNGGISSVPRAVDLWVVASRPQDKPGSGQIKPLHKTMLHQLHKTMLHQAKGRTAGHVLFLRGPKHASEGDTLAMLDVLGCRYASWSVLDKPTKQGLENDLCARPGSKDPCSSGILATAIAVYCGAASVRLVGFSLSPGYHYLPKERPQSWWRNHVAADRRALKALRARYGATLSGSILEAVGA